MSTITSKLKAAAAGTAEKLVRSDRMDRAGKEHGDVVKHSPDADADAAPELDREEIKKEIAADRRVPNTLPTTPDPKAAEDLRMILDGQFGELRESIREMLNDPFFLPKLEGTIEEQRDTLLPVLERFRDSGYSYDSFTKANGGSGKADRAVIGLETLGHADLSAMVKAGVQWGLWGGAIDNLGTERHRHYIQPTMDLELMGVYAMTEIGHGSNVAQLQTTATYDPETQEFIIHSPSPSAKKVYLGNAARHGRVAAVFAQLYTPGVEESHGVHCLVVPIRDENLNPLPGVTIGDHGRKGGLLGVDNGTLMFDNVRVPRENLLNRFGDVDEAGNYTSPIESKNRRFFTVLSTLIRGRIAVGGAANAATRTSLDIAVRYATRRRQFSPGGDAPEKRLIEHRSHRLRLLVPLAKSYALMLLQNEVTARLYEQQLQIAGGKLNISNPSEEQLIASRELESWAAGLKAISTQHATRTIQECREACGGAGYMAENLLTTFKADSDVFTTFEGDNTVLIQMVGKEMLTAYARDMGDLNALDMVRYGIDEVSDLIRRRSGLHVTVQTALDAARRNNDNSLFDAGYQVSLLEDRSQKILKSLAGRMRAARKLDPEEAAKVVDQAQDHLIAAGWARMESLALQSLVEAESKLPADSPARHVLEQVRDLYALSTIVEHAGWYQEHNMLSGLRLRMARAAVRDLVDSLGPWAEVLVDAFAIPEAIRNVPMLNQAGVDEPRYA
ncbi:acyl-CoA dehydrogenase family protein [Corynebacterium kozikiae]|uniref:acyl-CoA dehydrogenase family protein n=1 Tax=Corynebacterium kozikiae TaxID=2968469 RepID=UPI00211C079E|nr:acyl-CoA dehydrogenase family protein [Corynebacterium sp. 76QC2CO]MCQ9344068.1 acyl-CoA dehydrogenase family protein [Corynebacterium sp. 76QC2CO]